MIHSFLTVAQQVLILFALMAVGFVLGKVRLMDDRGSLAMTNLVMYAVSPAMMVVAFQRDRNAADLSNFLLCLPQRKPVIRLHGLTSAVPDRLHQAVYVTEHIPDCCGVCPL